MANVQNTSSLNSELFQNLLVQSQFALYENSIARSLATVFDYPVGAGKVVSVPVWDAIVSSKPAEGVAPDKVGTETNSKTITLAEHVTFAQVTDFLRDSAQENVIASLATQMGLALAEGLDKELISLFYNSAITQSAGAGAGQELTAAQIMKAAAIIRGNKYTGPLVAVLHPLQAYGLKAALTATNSYQAATNVGNAAMSQYYVGSIGGVSIYESSLVDVDANGDASGAVFAPAAFGLAQRGGVSMETMRQAAERATDVVETVVAGVGILRPELAVKIFTDGTV